MIIQLLTENFLMSLYGLFCTCVVPLVLLRKSPRRHLGWIALFLLYLSFVYGLTGIGTVWHALNYSRFIRNENLVLIPFYQFTLREAILNLVMTVPLGVFAAWLWRGMRNFKSMLLLGLCFSLAIELSQLLTIRAATVDDLLLNTLGTVLGYVVFRCLPFKPKGSIATYETFIILVGSFLGNFFLFNPLLGY